MNKKIELLSPAGSLPICKAVINAGADAVYLSGKSFGARAYANNFTQEEIIEALYFAHLHDKKIYLTVNTVLKEDEINKLIYYLAPLYEAGLSAVIVQDFGVLKLISESFKDLDIHTSTQMNVSTHFFANDLKKYNVKRIVLPRELSLEEIRDFKNNTDLELEAFIHGAYCYAHSGKCTMSSSRGVRSGNRGKCAQPCRLEYEISSIYNIFKNESVKVLNNKKMRLLSPKDVWTIDILREIILSGVTSLKIEGRMKNVNYAAGTTSIYRRYLDEIENNGVDENTLKKAKEDLLDLFNRGSFTTGFYNNVKGGDLLSLKSSGHLGRKAVKVISNKKGLIRFLSLIDLNAQDVIFIRDDFSLTLGKNVKAKEEFEVNLPQRLNILIDETFYRVNNAFLQNEIKENYIDKNKKVKISLSFVARVGRPTSLSIFDEKRNIKVKCLGELVQSAKASSIKEEDIKKRLSKLGNTDFVTEKIDILIDDNIFISNGGLNSLRREAIEVFTNKIYEKYSRKPLLFDNDLKNDIIGNTKNHRNTANDFVALVFKKEQLLATLESNIIKRIYISYHIFDLVKDEIKDRKKEIYIALPYFVHQKHLSIFKKYLKELEKYEYCFDGFLIRNMEEASILKNSHFSNKKFAIDYNIYFFNNLSYKFLYDYFSKDVSISYPIEMSYKEMEEVLNKEDELLIYGRYPTMFSEHCTKKVVYKCDKNTSLLLLKGENDKENSIFTFCDYCGNVIFSEEAINVINSNLFENTVSFTPRHYRLDFILESYDETKKILHSLETKNKNHREFVGRYLTGIE